MKTLIFLFIAIASVPSLIIAQQSDYKTVQEFSSEIELFKHQIDNSITSEQLENIEVEIDEFLIYYSENIDLLNRALYPSNVASLIYNLKSRLKTNENRLVMIEHQREQLFEMSSQIIAQRSEINRLYTITESLKSEILSSQASESRLSEMISNYRESLDQRDKLIFEMIDSLLITHENYAFNKLNDGESQSFTITSSQNPLLWIETVLDENMKFSKQQNRLLNVEDYIRMHSLQQHFENVWSQVGDDLVTVYGNDQKTVLAQSIESKINNWRDSSTEQMWTAINQYLDIHEIEITSFDTKESFFLSLEAFILNGRELSDNEILTTNGYLEYQKVANFWSSTFKNDWNLVGSNTRLLSQGEIAMIDVALTNWEETSRPIHPMLVAIMSIMIVSLTGFILVMFRAKATH